LIPLRVAWKNTAVPVAAPRANAIRNSALPTH
jgi:hypothetical protein